MSNPVEELKHDRENRGSAHLDPRPEPKKSITPTQIAWRVGLFILGAVVGAVLDNL